MDAPCHVHAKCRQQGLCKGLIDVSLVAIVVPLLRTGYVAPDSADAVLAAIACQHSTITLALLCDYHG